MMEGHEAAVYKDLGGKNDVKMEVNWSGSSGDTVRITIGDKVAIIPYENLYGFVFVNAEGEKMDKLLPVTQTVITKFRRVHNVKLKRPMSKDDIVHVRCEMDVPTSVMQALKGDVEKIKPATPFIVPGVS